ITLKNTHLTALSSLSFAPLWIVTIVPIPHPTTPPPPHTLLQIIIPTCSLKPPSPFLSSFSLPPYSTPLSLSLSLFSLSLSLSHRAPSLSFPLFLPPSHPLRLSPSIAPSPSLSPSITPSLSLSLSF